MDIMDDGARAQMERVAARLRAFHDERVAVYRSHLQEDPDGPLPQSPPTVERLHSIRQADPSVDGG